MSLADAAGGHLCRDTSPVRRVKPRIHPVVGLPKTGDMQIASWLDAGTTGRRGLPAS